MQARRIFWSAVAGCAALVAALTIVLLVAPGQRFATAADDLAETVVPLLAGALCIYTGTRLQGRGRWAWLVFGSSPIAWGLGQAAWTWQELVLNAKPADLFPSYPDLGYLSAVPLGVIGLLLFPGTGRRWGTRARALLDGCIAGGALLFISWSAAFGPLYENSGDDVLTKFLGLAYPVGDLVMVTIVITTLLRVPRPTQVVMGMIGLGILSNAVADTGFNYLTQIQSYSTTNLIDAGWVVGYLLIGLAALRQLTHPVVVSPEDSTKPSPFVSAIPYVVVLLACAVAVERRLATGNLELFLFLDAIVVIGLVLLRQLLLLRDYLGLNRKLEEHVAERTAELEERNRQLHYSRLHDSLTELPNRFLFEDRVDNALRRHIRSESWGVAVVVIDLDDFKMINDRFGHAAADTVLVETANRLRAELRPGDTVARMGADEFAVLVEGISGPAQAEQIADRMLDAVAVPMEVDRHPFSLRASVGVAMSVAERTTAETLMGDAELAVYRAKMAGGGRTEFFDPTVGSKIRERLQLQKDLEVALVNGELFLEYQPVVALTSGQVLGFEALVRWHHPERGVVPPIEFIPLAEQTGLIVPIGDWVIAAACEQLAEICQATGRRDVTMAVNVSARQLRSSSVYNTITQNLEKYHLPANALTVEVTESVLIEDLTSIKILLNRLRDLGVGLALDDFGTGFSSLSYLQEIPATQIKIDRSFVKELLNNPQNATLVRAIIQMGLAFDLEIVAEGIEGLAESEELVQMKCVVGQGFYFSRPVAAEVAREVAATGFSHKTRPGTYAGIPARKTL